MTRPEKLHVGLNQIANDTFILATIVKPILMDREYQGTFIFDAVGQTSKLIESSFIGLNNEFIFSKN